MTMKRVSRGRPLTAEEAARFKTIREQVKAELPELIARHQSRLNGGEPVVDIVKQLKAAREAQGLSLSDVTDRTHIDAAALSTLENDPDSKPTVDTLARYAEAVGKRLFVGLVNH